MKLPNLGSLFSKKLSNKSRYEILKRNSKVGDADIREALANEGDDGAQPRHSIFYFYGGDLNGMFQAAEAANFFSRSAAEPGGLVLEKTISVDEVSFAPIAKLMEKWAGEFGSKFDGWECQVADAM